MSPRASQPLISSSPPSATRPPESVAAPAVAQLPREILGTEYIALLKEHLISHDPGGMTIQFHVAVIAALLIHLRTGRKPGVYTLHCLRRVAVGALSVERMLYILARHDHARDLEQARLARKRAAKTATAKMNG